MLQFERLLNKQERICVVGLGYVGMPLAALFSKKFDVIGFDVNARRIKGLRAHYDSSGEMSEEDLKRISIEYTEDPEKIREASVVVVTVPTPVSDHKIPDLSYVEKASAMVGRHMKKGCVVVYESTVYPGVTEKTCVPILQRESGLRWKEDFHVGYSPERVNPGDKLHSIDKIVKVVSGDTPEITRYLAEMYGAIVTAGIHVAPNIQTAEAAKVIENIQRDLNIALINELAIIFHKMGLDTREVLNASSTKWNFLKFEPGLVGGHCIGVDPYYLTFKAEELGYHPEVILAGRRINDSMGKYVADQALKIVIREGKVVKESRILVLGFTFKENVPDIRNSKVIDVVRELKEYGAQVYVYDPLADGEEAMKEYGIEIVKNVDDHKPYDAIVFAVRHASFSDFTLEHMKKISNGKPILVDVKGVFDREEAASRGIAYWRV